MTTINNDAGIALAPAMRFSSNYRRFPRFSMPLATYGHSVDEGAHVILAVLEALALPVFMRYEHKAALAPHRIACLVLSQTPLC